MYVKFVLRFYRKSFQMFSYGERREDGRRDEKKMAMYNLCQIHTVILQKVVVDFFE